MRCGRDLNEFKMAPGQRQARVRDRFGAVLTASMSVLLVVAVVGSIALFTWQQTRRVRGFPTTPWGSCS